MMSLLPNMTVVSPGDPVETAALFPQLLQLDGPSYFTVGRYGEPVYEAEEVPVLGKARLLRSGGEIALLSTGDMAAETLKAADLLAADGIRPVVYQFHTVKPLDTATLDLLADAVETIVVAEEHVPTGGLAGSVCAWAAERGRAPRIVRKGPRDAFALGNLDRATLRRRWEFDAEAIAEACRAACRAAIYVSA